MFHVKHGKKSLRKKEVQRKPYFPFVFLLGAFSLQRIGTNAFNPFLSLIAAVAARVARFGSAAGLARNLRGSPKLRGLGHLRHRLVRQGRRFRLDGQRFVGPFRLLFDLLYGVSRRPDRRAGR